MNTRKLAVLLTLMSGSMLMSCNDPAPAAQAGTSAKARPQLAKTDGSEVSRSGVGTSSPEPAGLPSPVATSRQFVIDCPSNGGNATYRIGSVVARKGLTCEDGEPSLDQSRDFGAAGALYLVIKPMSMDYSTGQIVFAPRQGALRIVDVEYIGSFEKPAAIDRVTVGAGGIVGDGKRYWRCELRIDWTRAVIVSRRWVGGDAGTRGQCTE